jgi:myo-inositol-1(or 4)-monophosphatase
MPDTQRLLKVCCDLARESCTRLASETTGKDYHFSESLSKEVKTKADKLLEEVILATLGREGLPVLSEEAGYLEGNDSDDLWFLVDPLDGTFNYVRELGPCAISLALWKGMTPVFGVIYHLTEQRLYWGGPDIGAFCDGEAIGTSSVPEKGVAALCTGFPARHDIDNNEAILAFGALVRPYAKIRMVGSAAAALLLVSRGAADAYNEKNIMLWDIAAGLAILAGAGGKYRLSETKTRWSVNVAACNGHIALE